jgi:hypothetical protein
MEPTKNINRGLCGMCSLKCKRFALKCIECSFWVHYSCTPLTKDDFEALIDCKAEFVCPKCATTGNASQSGSVYNIKKAIDETETDRNGQKRTETDRNGPRRN